MMRVRWLLGRIVCLRIVRLKQIINFFSLLLSIGLLLIFLFLEIICFIVLIPWVTSIMVSLIIAHVLPLILIELLYLFDSIPAFSAIVHLVMMLLLNIKVLFIMLVGFGWPLFKVQSFLRYRLLMPQLWVVRCLWPHISYSSWLSIGSVRMWNSGIRGGWKGTKAVFERGSRAQKLKLEITKLCGESRLL